ncbi:calcium-binding protein [Aquincola sp. S2]|uniref:Calcium-binding protein n=1 Tax=Pseudaquabacterium terrae TaxID=2732868 RepID=A0ABX2EAF7_9BURK|nr:calcium-binding protein [Aquabacterium terrae]NRF65384.1 calcium-binding protein [Aquabacterium terrae]
MTIIIHGDNNANVLNASALDDHELYGHGANDTLNGNIQDDLLDGGTGGDKMSGGAGNDVFIVDNIADTVADSSGTDRVESTISYTLGATIENLYLTGAANINGTGNGLVNKLIGNSGNNTLNGGAGADVMAGGNGNDTYFVDNAGDALLEFAGAGTGIDWVNSTVSHTLGVNFEHLDLIGIAPINGTGNDLANTIYGNSANNVIDGKAGADTMAGAGGNDTYYVDVAADVVSEAAGGGTDTVYSRAATFTLGANVEHLDLLNTAIIVVPGGGFDVLPGGIDGTGNSLANTIEGSSGANVLRGMGGNDTIYGEGGHDTLDGGTGNDNLHGGTGDDQYVVDAAGDNVIELAGEGTDSVSASVTHTLDANVEKLTLTGVGNINGTGNALANTITGNAGSNWIDGGAGADTMSGGAGNDFYVIDNAGDVASELAGGGTDWVYAGISHTLADPDIENLVLTGVAAINGTGHAGANSIHGNAGNNVLMGQAGNDTLYGNGGNDTLQGGTGADAIHGGVGNDTLRAVDNVAFVDDAAEDRFHFDTALNAFTNVDLIDKANFTAAGGEGTDDELVLENSIFSALLSTVGTNTGTLGAAYYFEGAANGSGQFDPIGIYNNTATGQLFYNPTFGTAGDSVLFAVVNLVGVAGGSAVLSAEEFTLG